MKGCFKKLMPRFIEETYFLIMLSTNSKVLSNCLETPIMDFVPGKFCVWYFSIIGSVFVTFKQCEDHLMLKFWRLL